MIYFIVFGSTIKSIAVDLIGPYDEDEKLKKIVCTQAFWIIFLAILITPVIIKKEL